MAEISCAARRENRESKKEPPITSALQLLALSSLFLTFPLAAPLQSQQVQYANINNVRYASGFVGADAGAKIAACIADLPSTGGTCDARGLEGVQSAATTIVIDKPAELLLGAMTLTGPTSGPIIQVEARGVIIQGMGASDAAGGSANSTVLLAQAAGNSHGIYASTIGYGHRRLVVHDLRIENTGAGRTAGDGIYVDAGAANSVSHIERVVVVGMWDGIYLNKPITTAVYGCRSEAALNDGFVFQGGGTSVSFINDYSSGAARYGFLQRGGEYTSYINTASDSSGTNNYRIERISGMRGSSATTTTMVSPGSERTSSGAGVYILDALAVTIISPTIRDAGGDGVHLDGGRDVSILGGSIFHNGGYGIRITSSTTPIMATSVTGRGISFSANASGDISDAPRAYFEMGRDGDAYFRPNIPIDVNNRSVTNIAKLSTSPDQSQTLDFGRYSSGFAYAVFNALTSGSGFAFRTDGTDRLLIQSNGQVDLGVSGARATIDTSGNILPAFTGKSLGDVTHRWDVHARVSIAAINVVPFSSTPTFNASLGNTQKIVLKGDVTSSGLSNTTAGQELDFIICQDGTGNHRFAWPSNVKGGMTISTDPSTCSTQQFIFDGDNAYAISQGVTGM